MLQVPQGSAKLVVFFIKRFIAVQHGLTEWSWNYPLNRNCFSSIFGLRPRKIRKSQQPLKRVRLSKQNVKKQKVFFFFSSLFLKRSELWRPFKAGDKTCSCSSSSEWTHRDKLFYKINTNSFFGGRHSTVVHLPNHPGFKSSDCSANRAHLSL